MPVSANPRKPEVQNPGFESSPFLIEWETKVHLEQQNGRAPSLTRAATFCKTYRAQQETTGHQPHDGADGASQPLFMFVHLCPKVKTETVSRIGEGNS
jgi:hypothetical protein